MKMETVSLVDIASMVAGTIEGLAAGDGSDIRISGLNTLSAAGATEISFLSNQAYKSQLEDTAAAAVLLDANTVAPDHCAVIRVSDPYLAFASLQRFFYPFPVASGQRHASAVIDATAVLADDVDVAATAVIAAGVRIESGTMIGAGCVIGEGVHIGKRCRLLANTVVNAACILGSDVILQPGAVIGSDGFGYVWNGSQHLKIPQVGRVIIEDDVEIGANTCIDRGAVDDTVIERGVKLDNQIQIGHNVRVGAFSVMASQGGISGSTQVGQGCQFGGQVGIAGHLRLGNGVKLAGKTGVMSDLEAGGTYGGVPAMPHVQWLKISALIRKLPEIWKALHKRS